MIRTALAALSLAALTAHAQDNTAVQQGTLRCSLTDSSNLVLYSTVDFDCVFDPEGGDPEMYAGRIEKIGIDLSTTEAEDILWYVYMPSGKVEKGALAGSYLGASADVSIGEGAGVRLLVGGDGDAISLQPASVETQKGFGAALGGEQFTLTAK